MKTEDSALTMLIFLWEKAECKNETKKIILGNGRYYKEKKAGIGMNYGRNRSKL